MKKNVVFLFFWVFFLCNLPGIAMADWVPLPDLELGEGVSITIANPGTSDAQTSYI